MTVRDSSFDRIREEVSRDLRPLRPIRAPWSSSLIAIPLALVLLSFVLLFYGLRSDAAAIGAWPLWGPAAFMVAAAYGVLVLALSQRTPDSTLRWTAWILVPLGAVAVQIGGAYLTSRYSVASAPVQWPSEAMCMFRISLLGVVPALTALWLLTRGLPLRPKLAGLFAGLAGGMLAEGVYRLHCGLSHPGHVAPWHTGAVLVIGLLGGVFGLWWERNRIRRFLNQRS